MMAAETMSNRYFALWMSAPAQSGVEQAASEVMAALETEDAGGVIAMKWSEALEVMQSAESLGDEQARVYYEEKIGVYTQFVNEWLTAIEDV